MNRFFCTPLFLLIFSVCSAQKAVTISYKVLWSGKNSEIYYESFTVINSEKEYKALWDKVKDPMKPLAPVEVDFDKDLVVAYFAGDQTNGTAISKVEQADNGIIIYIDRISASPNCQDAALLITPYFFIKIQKYKDCSVRYTSEVKIQHCK